MWYEALYRAESELYNHNRNDDPWSDNTFALEMISPAGEPLLVLMPLYKHSKNVIIEVDIAITISGISLT